jgi:hypothetical protein
MKVFKKFLILAFFLICFAIIAKLDNTDTSTTKSEIENAKAQRTININSHK